MFLLEFFKDKLRGTNLYLYLKLFPKWFEPEKPKFRKYILIRKLAYFTGIDTFVETGTCEGETIFNLYNDFQRIISIEFSPKLYKYAKKRFEKFLKISIIYGDSAEELPKIVENLETQAIFFLDAHYDGPISGNLQIKSENDPPLLNELESIISSNINHIILIDDARNLGNVQNYPSVNVIQDIIRSKKRNYSFFTLEDILLCLPREVLSKQTDLESILSA